VCALWNTAAFTRPPSSIPPTHMEAINLQLPPRNLKTPIRSTALNLVCLQILFVIFSVCCCRKLRFSIVVFLIYLGRFSVNVGVGRLDILLGLFVTFLSPSRLHNRLRPSQLIVRGIGNAVRAFWHTATSTDGSPSGDKPRDDPFYWGLLVSCTSLSSDARVRINVKWRQPVGLRAAICSRCLSFTLSFHLFFLSYSFSLYESPFVPLFKFHS
jgi:hypothetical protein